MLFLDTIGGIIHILDFSPALSESLDFFEAAGTVVDLAVFSENFGLLHHIFDILVDGDNAIEDILGPVAGEGTFCVNNCLVLLDLLLYVHQSFLDPI